MDKRIARLNHELGLQLGFAGTEPKFKWVRASEIFYLHRRGERYERVNWADRIGNVWLLAKWAAPQLSVTDWFTNFRGEFPYPHKGQYYALPETSLKPGLAPDENDTAQIVKTIQAQMDKKYADHLRECKADVQRVQDQTERDFYDEVDDFWPAFDNPLPGKRGGHISFGGI